MEDPKNGQSRLILKDNQRFWAKADEMRLADTDAGVESAPADPFKTEHIPLKYKFDITPNV